MLSHYNIGELQRVETFTTGTVQLNMLLHMTRGKFVLRCYTRSFESVLFEVNLTKYLKNKNFPCPDVLRDRHGNLARRYQDRPLAVFEYVEGAHVENPSINQQKQLIQSVAKLQNITRGYRSSYAKYRLNYDVGTCDRLANERTASLSSANAEKKLVWYRDEISKLVLPSSLPKGICHADFNYTNVLFKGKRFSALIDFDDANYTFLTFDLACLLDGVLYRFNWDSWKDTKPEDDIFDFESARRIISIYQQCRVLNPTERKYLFDVQKLVAFVDCIWFFDRGDASRFFERQKIDSMNALGRERFCAELFE